MKYSDMQKQLTSGRFEKRPRNTAKPAYNPAHSQELNLAEKPDLLSHLDAEAYLGERLKLHGCDIYDGGPFEHFCDRLRAAILANGMQTVILGRNKAGTLENYAQAFERVYGEALVQKVRSNRSHQKGNTTP